MQPGPSKEIIIIKRSVSTTGGVTQKVKTFVHEKTGPKEVKRLPTIPALTSTRPFFNTARSKRNFKNGRRRKQEHKRRSKNA